MTGDNSSSRTCLCPPPAMNYNLWHTGTVHVYAETAAHTCAGRGGQGSFILKRRDNLQMMFLPTGNEEGELKIWCTHQKVHLHSCIISTRRRDPKHVSVHTYRHTWQVLCELLPLMWQANILNHLVHLNFHFIAAASFQPRIEVDVLLHRQSAKVEIISWGLCDWHVKASPATYSQVFLVDKWPKMPD